MSDEFHHLIRELELAFDESNLDSDRVLRLMQAYRSNRDHWTTYCLEHDGHYTRSVVHKVEEKFDLLLLRFPPGKNSSIHDHAGCKSFVKVLQGRLTETRFIKPKVDGEAPQKVGMSVLERDSCTFMLDEHVLHSMANTDPSETAVSLHLHTKPFDWCTCYDPSTGERHEVQLKIHLQRGQICFVCDGGATIPDE